MIRSAIFVFLLVLSGPRDVAAQKVLRGMVFDAESGQRLPAANIQIEGTYRGTISNEDGLYQLRLVELPATLVVRYIGYETTKRRIAVSSSDRQDFRLEPVIYESEEVVVTGENPAVRIMREVIERKRIWRAGLETYTAAAYNRFAISNDSGIVSITETVTDAYWDRDRGTREVVRAQRETSNLEIDEAMPAAIFVSNLYDDDIEIAGHRLMGVTHPDALDEYRFRLEGTRRLGERLVYDISARPKRRTKSAFIGRVAVLDSAFALLEVELRPGDSFLFPPPFEYFTVTYSQQFSNFGTDFWLPVDFRAVWKLKLGFGFLLAMPQVNIGQVSRLTDYDVNVVLPDSIFLRDPELPIDSTSAAGDNLLHIEGVAVPLSREEELAYAEIDSSLRLIEAFKPTGLLAAFIDFDEDENGQSRSNARSHDGQSHEAKSALTGKWALPRLWYNRVDQFHVGIDGGVELARRLELEGGLGYDVAPDSIDRWTYNAAVRLELGPAGRGFIEAGYKRGSATNYRSELYSRFMNGAVVILGGDDYFDYFWHEGFEVVAGYGLGWSGATLEASYRQEDHQSLASTISSSPVGERDLRDNPQIIPGKLKAASAVFSIGDRFNTIGAVGRNRLSVEVERGGADFDYWRFGAVTDVRIPTFFRRRLLSNTLDVHAVMGTHSGSLPPQRFGVVEASLGPYRPFGGMRSLSHFPYVGDQWAGLFWEHSFRTVPFEWLGLEWPTRRFYNLILFGGHGRTWLSEDSETGFRVTDRWHHELGLSVSGIFGVIRADFAKRLDASGFTVGLAVARIF